MYFLPSSSKTLSHDRAVESEMKRLVQDSPLETERLTNMIHELNATVRRLERERDEASLKLERLVVACRVEIIGVHDHC